MNKADLESLRSRAKEKHDAAIRAAEREYQKAIDSINGVLALLQEPQDESVAVPTSVASPLSRPARMDEAPQAMAASAGAVPSQQQALLDSPTSTFKDLVLKIVKSMQRDFTMIDVVDVLRAKYPTVVYTRPTLSGTLLRLAEVDKEMQIVERGAGTRPSKYRPKANALSGEKGGST